MPAINAAEQDSQHFQTLKGREAFLQDQLGHPEAWVTIVAHDKLIADLADLENIGTLHNDDVDLIIAIRSALDHKKALELYEALGGDVRFPDIANAQDAKQVTKNNVSAHTIINNADPDLRYLDPEEYKVATAQYDSLVNPDLNHALAELSIDTGPLDWTPSDATRELLRQVKPWAIEQATKSKEGLLHGNDLIKSSYQQGTDDFLNKTARPFYQAHKDEIQEAAIAAAKRLETDTPIKE